ncbi:MAG: NnrS family protein [Ancalomicrobiaceae bacterium]|nr:NnrS family protein [Ancalomicrobiaceae bacterium]
MGSEPQLSVERTAARQRNWTGAALWSRGFRPFFLAAGLWALAAIAVWPFVFTGAIALPTQFSAIDWHVHEMLFGYGPAVIAGFLLTAVPNWTGRLPVAGYPLMALAAVWAIGRIAVLVSADIGWVAAAIADCAFLVGLAALIAREVVSGNNGRNLKVVGVILVLAGANVGFHVEAHVFGTATIAVRAGLAGIVFLVLLIGGRIVPSFTHNWLARQSVVARPVPFGRADGVVMVISGLALVLWILAAYRFVAGPMLILAGIGNLWRLSRWQGLRTFADRLVLVLHAGFLLAALGFLFAGVETLRPDLVTQAAAAHVWAIGGIGTMTLAMVTRVTLGHSGRALVASPGTQAIYAAVIVAAVARVAMEFLPDYLLPLLYLAAFAWVAAFAGYLWIYAPILAGRANR